MSSEHLEVVASERGFDHLPPIPGAYGGEATVYESSAAISPHVWLRVEQTAESRLDGQDVEATLHLTAEDAWKLADQLRYLVANHYHGDARPEWADDDRGRRTNP